MEMIKVRQREEYGQVPKYLCERKKKIQKECEVEKSTTTGGFIVKQGQGTSKANEKIILVDPEDREKLLEVSEKKKAQSNKSIQTEEIR